MFWVWLVSTVFFSVAVSSKKEGCSVNLDSMDGKFPPLLLQDGKFIFPTSRDTKKHRILKLDEGEKIELYCHGSFIHQKETVLKIRGVPKTNSVELKCSGGKFMAKSKKVDVEKATCSKKQEPVITRSKEACSQQGVDENKSPSNLVLVKIGWLIRGNLLEQIRLCHDESKFGTIWTRHVVRGASIGFRDTDGSRPGFRTDNSDLKRFYPGSSTSEMNKLYSKKEQKGTVEEQLGLNRINSEPIIETGSRGTHYFAKGHLSPDAAFVYNVQQDATYYFMNVAPQFQSFNNGNWKALEANTRDLAEKLGRNVIVYTGTYGVLEYKDKKGKKEEIYIDLKGQNEYIPVPLYYWKVLIDPKTKTSAAFIGLNDPHATDPPKEMCTNVCSKMAWVDWDLTELDKGYMYCCTLESARKSIPAMPDFQSEGLIQLS